MDDDKLERAKANPWQPERSPIRLAILGKLGEELAENGAAVARCVIQGLEEREPETGRLNVEWLEDEIADVMAAQGVAIERLGLNVERITARAMRKTAHLQQWHEQLEAGKPAAPAKGYTGPIEVGREYIWEPTNPRACEHIKVLEIRKGWIKTLARDGRRHWNEEDRFREACVPRP